MIVYSSLLTLALVLGSPWWLWRMATSGRYRQGLSGRIGVVPSGLRTAVAGRKVIWVHAVSVGEVLAATRLIAELQHALPEHVLVVSTTTATGQAIARERLPGAFTFFLPLDFAFVVRRYLRVLRPELVVMLESELWPRLLVECERARIPITVANARISDRSFPRYMRLRKLWRPLLAKVSLFLAQSEQSAERLRAIGAPMERLRVVGNLKYDQAELLESATTQRLRRLLAGHKLVVAGSTLAGEEEMLLRAWGEVLEREPDAVLVLAPRHSQRFRQVQELLSKSTYSLIVTSSKEFESDDRVPRGGDVILLDTLGDLGAVYGLATVAFVGGSLVPKGGHNPLEPARFGVPMVMGPSYENFREIVDGMRVVDALNIVERDGLGAALIALLADGRVMGKRGRRFFEEQAGATGRTVQALLNLLAEQQ